MNGIAAERVNFRIFEEFLVPVVDTFGESSLLVIEELVMLMSELRG